MSAISIYNSLKKVIKATLPFPESLQKIADLLYTETGLKVEFCKIIGKRWSHVAGHPDFLGFGERFILNENLGILVEDQSMIPQDEWNQILKLLKMKLQEQVLR